ncbi:L-threonylcarbamoyladenylate synthase [Cuniculiplasma sp. SKW3]|uniref:L-threonylcarbamoyladenylate synthase n=1 Tax=unclassified Cuniculiplasma TaxID=2619706 RepID=UPI003FD020CC
MVAKVLDVSCDLEDSEKAMAGSRIIQGGGVVIFPTETVYGIGADAENNQSCQKIYKIKGRQPDNPLIVHVADLKQAEKYAYLFRVKKFNELSKFWPGPLTIVMPKKPTVSDVASAGLDTVGIRIPDCAFTREFIKLSERGIAAPSANMSGRPSATRAEHIINELKEVDLIYRAEPSRIGIESTVIYPQDNRCVILRPGAYTEDDFSNIFDEVVYAKPEDPVRSPGMKYRHYSPEKILLRAKRDDLLDYVEKHSDVIPIVTEETAKNIKGEKWILGSIKNPYEISSSLYDLFRRLDGSGYSRGIIECLPETGFFNSIMNRIKKASVEL